LATLADVERISMALPEVEEGTSYGNRAWNVKKKSFAWERPLSKKDQRELGDLAPDGDILGVRVEDEMTKEMLCENEGPAIFTTTHFDGFNAALIVLDQIEDDLLEDLITDSWRITAPARLAKEFDDD
jgi:hypothetical protein